MRMSRSARSYYLVKHIRSALFLGVTLCLVGAADAVDRNTARSVANKPTRYYLFDMVPGGTYDVQKNSAPLTQVNASFTGSLSFNSDSDTGDQFLIILNGVNAQPPSPPTALAIVGDTLGCAHVSWSANPESDIVGYTIYYDTLSVETGQIAAYRDSVPLGRMTGRTICGLADATYYVAVRARNGFGLLSGLSAEESAQVSNGGNQSQPLTPPQNVRLTTSADCVTASWQASTEPDIDGYVVYYGPLSVTQGQTAQYQDSLDVGNVTSREICAFSPGTYYFAVRVYDRGGSLSGYSTEREIDVVGVDRDPPELSGASPIDGQLQVPLDSPISFILSDAQSGVDASSITVTVDGATVTQITLVGDSTAYWVSARPDNVFDPLTSVDVTVTAADLANPANVMQPVSWRFTTGDQLDTTPPAFCCESPVNGAKGVDPSTSISFDITDIGAGVDINNLQIKVNGVDVGYGYSVDGATTTILYDPPLDFQGGSEVLVEVVGCDLASSTNCAPYSFSFTIAENGPSAEAPGAIYPDGYWVGDPTRALEVRNLPLGWTVRIFDTSGLQVTSFQNYQNEGYTWLWNDFTNDHGRRVAKALYLVRVTDEGGKVQSSGRFLVQGN